MHTTGDVTKQFGVSRTTVSNWCHEFSSFLSPTANPPVGAQRRFTDADLQVLALIYRQKRAGLTFDEIAAALATGERDEPPTDLATTTNAALERLQQRIVSLEDQLAKSDAARHRAEGQAELLSRQVDDLRAKIDALNREIGRLGG